ncbi:MAG: Trk system potassium uptake protein TrkA [SAR86 cluster bacterium SAR86B]|uniref:Trk system potassium uptake protein TrkA n=1 Tax=SAR86 cluster bacterium SAR86B TaxID=1123867 RepID=J4V2M1_9GAMM|nr:MAG: Trk system potassium uptake protein TrkA [SAR86 cluster bacterium SAR86B]
MKIVILGAGRIGGSLARNLSNSNYEVCIVDEDKNKLSDLEDKLDIMTVEGHASHLNTLKKSGLDNETTLLAVTSNDEVNIVACQLAKKVFKVKKTICRFRDDVYFDQLSVFGEGVIDIPISPEDEITSHLKELIDHPGSNQIESFANGKVKLVSVKAKKKGKLVGRELKGIKEDMPNIDAFVPTIYRKGNPFIPSGETIIKENDEIYFISSESNIGAIVDEFRDHEEQYSRIMIAGGGKVGFSLAKDLEKDYNVKLIDSNPERCMKLSKELDKTIVLSGSATDESLLKSENISNIDIFCALTDDDETNVMSSLLAKKMGAKKTMIILNNPSYLGLVPGFIDIYIAPYRLTVSSVLQDLRDSDVAQDVILKVNLGAEAIEGIVHANEFTSPLFGKPIKDVPLPEGCVIAAIIRHGELLMPSSSVDLTLNDHLIIFLSDKNKINEVEVLFK